MRDMRESIFSELVEIALKNPISTKICNFTIKIGLADFIYRPFSQKHLKNRQAFYKENKSKILKNIEILEDELSKETYKNAILYRCYRKRKHFPKYTVENQYFPEDIITLNSDEVFIDAGAYIGDTANEFIKRTNGQYKKIVCFEPDKSTYEILKRDLNNKKWIETYCGGLWSCDTKLHFNNGKKLGSSVSENGKDEIIVKAIDNMETCQDTTFLKMDVEGSELEALKGAEQTIKKNHPKLAICIYHSNQDMIDIIEYVHKTFPEYKIYIRHHSIFESETVMYAIL